MNVLKYKILCVFLILNILVGICFCCHHRRRRDDRDHEIREREQRTQEQRKREQQEKNRKIQEEKQICDSVQLNLSGLKGDLQTKLFGQHLVTQVVLRALKGHFSDPNPTKPLVLSFHGWTGGGKNYVASMIMNNIFNKQSEKHYHFYNSVKDFRHIIEVPKYKDELSSWIHQYVSECPRSMFVFDEVDHMPKELLDFLTSFLDYNQHTHGVDFKKSIVIFLSNSGGNNITKAVYEKWKKGEKRESLLVSDLQMLLTQEVFNAKGGFTRSNIIHKNLVDTFVPFLPLERQHVEGCVRLAVQKRFNLVLKQDEVNKILDKLLWFPKEEKLYSTSGCKKVESLVKQMVDEDGFIHEDL